MRGRSGHLNELFFHEHPGGPFMILLGLSVTFGSRKHHGGPGPWLLDSVPTSSRELQTWGLCPQAQIPVASARGLLAFRPPGHSDFCDFFHFFQQTQALWPEAWWEPG